MILSFERSFELTELIVEGRGLDEVDGNVHAPSQKIGRRPL